MAPERVAIELNHRVVRRSEWASTTLEDGDRIEIVHFVGGGEKPDHGEGVASQKAESRKQ